jgi:hypothetical protein
MAEIFTTAVALGAFWASCSGQPKLVDWPLRAFALALVLAIAGNLL